MKKKILSLVLAISMMLSMVPAYALEDLLPEVIETTESNEIEKDNTSIETLSLENPGITLYSEEDPEQRVITWDTAESIGLTYTYDRETKILTVGPTYGLTNENASLAFEFTSTYWSNYPSVRMATTLILEEGVKRIISTNRLYFLQEISIPSTVTTIDTYAFIGNSTSVENYDCDGNRGCAFWTYPDSDGYVEQTTNTRNYTSMKLKSIVVEKHNKNYSSKDGVLFNKDQSELIFYPRNRGAIYNSDTKTDTFSANGKVYEVPSTVKTIKNKSFMWSVGLEKVILNNGLEKIEPAAFYGALSLKEIDTSKANLTLKHIGQSAFAFSKILNFIFPWATESIDDRLFVGASFLRNIQMYNASGNIYNELNNSTIGVYGRAVYQNNGTGNVWNTLVSGANGWGGTISIKDGCKSVAARAFYGNLMQTLIIPDSVEVIGRGAFESGFGTSFSVNGITYRIQSNAAYWTSGIYNNNNSTGNSKMFLRNIKINKTSNLKTVENGAFYGQHNLTYIGNESPDYRAGNGTINDSIWQYEIWENFAVITGATQDINGMNVPSVIDGYPVVGFKMNSFGENTTTNINTLYIPTSINFLGTSSIYIQNVYYYGGNVTGSLSYSFATGVGAINRTEPSLNYSFLPNKIERLGNYAFYNSSLRQLNLSNSPLISNSHFAFGDNYNLKSLILNNSMISGSYMFYGCNHLTEVTIVGETPITSYMFSGCTSLEKIINSENIVAVGDYAFQNCKFSEFTINEKVTSLGANAFQFTNLQNLHIPATLLSLNENSGAIGVRKYVENNETKYSIINLTVDPANPNYEVDSVFLYNKAKTNLIKVATSELLTDVVIPEGVTTIGGYAFYYCNDMESVTLPSTLLSINSYAFSNCGIKSLDFSNTNITQIPSYLASSSKLESVKLNNKITSIGNYAFSNSQKLKTVDINNSPTKYIYNHAFSQCISLESINITRETPLDYIAHNSFYGTTSLKQFIFPDSLRFIEYYAFYNTLSLEEIDLSNCKNLTFISYYAFSNSGIIRANLSNMPSLNSIQYAAFYNTSKLQTIDLSNSFNSTQIASNFMGNPGSTGVFENSAVEYINLTNAHLSQIKGWDFRNANNLKKIDMRGSDINFIYQEAFLNDSSLEYVYLPSHGENLEIGYHAFYGLAKDSVRYFYVPQNIQLGEEAIWFTVDNGGDHTAPISIHKDAHVVSNSIGGTNKDYFQIFFTNDAFAKTIYGNDLYWWAGFDLDYNSQYVSNYQGNIKRLYIPDVLNAVEILGLKDGTFKDNNSIEYVWLPEYVTTINTSLFEGSSSIQDIGWNNVTSIGSRAFANSGITTLEIPAQVKTIGSESFSGSNITNLTLNNGLEVIKDNAFENTKSLKALSVPVSLNNIGNNAFKNSGIETINSSDIALKLKDLLSGISGVKILEFPYSGAVEKIELSNGIYKLEAWGAQGGALKAQESGYEIGQGGYGGYSTGILNLDKASNVFVYVGGMGTVSAYSLAYGGFNGGGDAWGTSTSEPAAGGGGASDIRIGTDSLYARVLVAGGGGGGGEDRELGGYGGGETGGGSPGGNFGGTQNSSSKGGVFGNGAHTNFDGGGGGGGWFGGGTNGGSKNKPTINNSSDTSGGSGGSGYVLTVDSYKPAGYELSESFYLKDATTVAGNDVMPTHDGLSTMTGNSGNGFIKITALRSPEATALRKLNFKMNISASLELIDDNYGNCSSIIDFYKANPDITWDQLQYAILHDLTLVDNTIAEAENYYWKDSYLEEIVNSAWIANQTNDNTSFNYSFTPDALSAIGISFDGVSVPDYKTVDLATYKTSILDAVRVLGDEFYSDPKNVNIKYPHITWSQFQHYLLTNKVIDKYSAAKISYPWKDSAGVNGEDYYLEISDGAFQGSNISNYDVPFTAIIGYEAFIDCKNIEEFNMPEQLMLIKERAFYNSSLKTLTFNESVETIEKSAFAKNENLESINFVEGITNIQDFAFQDCSSLKSIRLPNSLTNLGTLVFSRNTSLSTVYFGSGLSEIPDSTFLGDTGLERVALSDSITSIGNSAFAGALGFDYLIIPESVTHIGAAAIPEGTIIAIVKDSLDGIDIESGNSKKMIIAWHPFDKLAIAYNEGTYSISYDTTYWSKYPEVVETRYSIGFVDLDQARAGTIYLDQNELTGFTSRVFTLYFKDEMGNEGIAHVKIEGYDVTTKLEYSETSFDSVNGYLIPSSNSEFVFTWSNAPTDIEIVEQSTNLLLSKDGTYDNDDFEWEPVENAHSGTKQYSVPTRLGTFVAAVKDKEGNVWVATFNNTYLKMDDEGPDFSITPNSVLDSHTDSHDKTWFLPHDTEHAMTITMKDEKTGIKVEDTWKFALNDAEIALVFDGDTTTRTATIDMNAKNGTLSVDKVFDQAGNETSKDFIFDSFDYTAPSVSIVENEVPRLLSVADFIEKPTNDQIKITINAYDQYVDYTGKTVKGGVGLAVEPYSFDGGITWTDNNEYVFAENDSITIVVKDIFGNKTSVVHEVGVIDVTPPVVELEQKSDSDISDGSWSNSSMTIIIHATDIGLGLANEPYSLDEGSTWTSDATFTANTPGTYSVLVRDAAGNTASASTTVENIDAEAPVVSAYTEVGDNVYVRENMITIVASDGLSGLHDTPYSVDGGLTWSSSNHIKVYENKTYTIVVRDKAGNTASTTVTISSLDNTPPVIDSVDYSPKELTVDTVTITVTAHDDEGSALDVGNHYSIDNGETWQNSNEFIVDKSGTYTVSVKDDVGNVVSEDIIISNIVAVKPTFNNISTVPADWTTKDVKIVVNATGGQGTSNLVAEIVGYKFDDNEWSTKNEYTVSENRVVPISIKDSLGNISSTEFRVSTIDRTAPSISLNASNADGSGLNLTNGKVSVSVKAIDNQSGLNKTAYSYNNGTWTDSSVYEVRMNSTLNVRVRDAVGNIAEASIEITNFDLEKPVIESIVLSNEEKTNQDITLTINAHDDISGLNEFAYALDTKDTWQKSNVFVITHSGTYTVYVKDAVGNIESKSIKIDNIIKAKPNILSVDYSKTEWTKNDVKVSINVTAEAGIKQISFDNGNTWQAETSKIFTKNVNDTIIVEDNVGNKTFAEVIIENIDKVAPDVIIRTSENDTTNKFVKISVLATDNASGLATEAYSFDGGDTWTATSELFVNNNKNISVCVRDAVSNIYCEDVNITNIDKEVPNIEISYDENWTNEDVTVTVTASDNVGLAETAYSFDNGQTWKQIGSYNYSSNGSYSVMVADSSGNIASKVFEISNIDKIAPVVTLDRNTDIASEITITVIAEDNESGLADEAYSYMNDNSWESNNSFVIAENDNFIVYVKDVAGNITVINEEIDNIDSTPPTIESITSDREDWTNNNVTITVVALDDIALHPQAYSFDNGLTWQTSSEFEVQENSIIEISVRDLAGNVTEDSIQIDNIDNTLPEVSYYRNFADDEGTIIYESGDITNQNVLITVEAEDLESGLDVLAYSFNNDDWQAENTYLVTENGPVTIMVRDSVGNIYQENLIIDEIYRETIVIGEENIILSTNEYTIADIIVTVVMDKDLDAESYLYSFDGGETFNNQNSVIVTENTTLQIIVKDIANNLSNTLDYAINLIDRVAPTFDIDLVGYNNDNEIVDTPFVGGYIKLTVDADDAASGIAGLGYMFDNENWISSNTYNIYNNGTVNVCVKDVLNNKACKSVEITSIVESMPILDDVVPNIALDIITSHDISFNMLAHSEIEEYGLTYYVNGENVQSNQFVATDNGEYTFYVMDAAGNKSNEIMIEVTNIDKTLPTIKTINFETIEESNLYKMTIEAEDKNALTYSIDGETFFESNIFEVVPGETITVYVKDAAENTVQKNAKALIYETETDDNSSIIGDVDYGTLPVDPDAIEEEVSKIKVVVNVKFDKTENGKVALDKIKEHIGETKKEFSDIIFVEFKLQFLDKDGKVVREEALSASDNPIKLNLQIPFSISKNKDFEMWAFTEDVYSVDFNRNGTIFSFVTKNFANTYYVISYTATSGGPINPDGDIINGGGSGGGGGSSGGGGGGSLVIDKTKDPLIEVPAEPGIELEKDAHGRLEITEKYSKITSFVPFTVIDGKVVIAPFSSVYDNHVYFISPLDGEYRLMDNLKTFTDVEEDFWARPAIEALSSRAVFTGYPDGTFGKDDNISRADFVTALMRLETFEEYEKSSFNDVDIESYYGQFIEFAYQNGIISGVSDDLFDPERAITREEISVIIANYIEYKKFVLEETEEPIKLKDIASVAEWATEAVDVISKYGLVNGDDKKNFNPKNNATRSECAQILYNLIQNVVKVLEKTQIDK